MAGVSPQRYAGSDCLISWIRVNFFRQCHGMLCGPASDNAVSQPRDSVGIVRDVGLATHGGGQTDRHADEAAFNEYNVRLQAPSRRQLWKIPMTT